MNELTIRYFPSCSGLREHSVCTTSATDLQQSPVDEHAPVEATDDFNRVPGLTGTVPPAFSADSREIGRSVMESTECGESKLDLGLVIIDTACLFCVAGSDWSVYNKNVLVDVGLRHEIAETGGAERYKFGDGGTLVSSIRVTAPVVVAGHRRKIVFSVAPSKHVALVDRSRFPDPCSSCRGHG